MGLLLVLFTAFFWAAVIGGGFYIAIRALRALEQRNGLPARADPQALGSRVARLEDALEQLSAEMERLAEGQQFTHRLLAERHAERHAASGAGSGNADSGTASPSAPASPPPDA